MTAGRPKAEKPLSVKYSIRLDMETEERLKVLCEKYGITRGAAIRKAIELMLDTDERGR